MTSQHYGFAKLVSLNGDEFYIKSATLVLGRNTARNDNVLYFCPLSTSKQISRKHAKIFFDYSSYCFKILCICKNDILVDKNLLSFDEEPVTLNNGSSIVIGDFITMFLLPVDFKSQIIGFKSTGKTMLKLDYDTTTTPRTNLSKMPKQMLSRPKEKLVSIVKQIICESPSQKMDFEGISKAVEIRYSGKYPEWISKSNWRHELKALLVNKRQFFQFTDRFFDSKKRPVFVESYTLKKLAPRVAPQFDPKKPFFGLNARTSSAINGALPAPRKSLLNISKPITTARTKWESYRAAPSLPQHGFPKDFNGLRRNGAKEFRNVHKDFVINSISGRQMAAPLQFDPFRRGAAPPRRTAPQPRLDGKLFGRNLSVPPHNMFGKTPEPSSLKGFSQFENLRSFSKVRNIGNLAKLPNKFASVSKNSHPIGQKAKGLRGRKLPNFPKRENSQKLPDLNNYLRSF